MANRCDNALARLIGTSIATVLPRIDERMKIDLVLKKQKVT